MRSALEDRARQLLQQRNAMLNLGLTPIEYVAFKLGCSYEHAERIVRRATEDDE